MTSVKAMVDSVYRKFFLKLSLFPPEYLAQLKLERVYENYKKDNKPPLAINSLFLLVLILEEEHKQIAEDILADCMFLLTLFFYAYGLYDAVYDQKQIACIPCANVLFKEAVLLAGKYGFKISAVIDTMEQYNLHPVRLNIGKVDIGKAADWDEHWYQIKNGFLIAPLIIKEFMAQFVPGCRYNWPLFFENYLLYNQILDDVNDFIEDYKNNEIKSYGIFALVKKFRNRKTINLKNFFCSLAYQSYILKNSKSLYGEFLERFWAYIAPDFEKEDFLKMAGKLKSVGA